MKKETIWHDEAVKVRGITMNEFNLSEKIKTKHRFNYENQGFHSDPLLIEIEDVKEFIKLLKEELNNLFEWGIETKNTNPNLADEIIEKIDKLIGEKLC